MPTQCFMHPRSHGPSSSRPKVEGRAVAKCLARNREATRGNQLSCFLKCAVVFSVMRISSREAKPQISNTTDIFLTDSRSEKLTKTQPRA